MQDLRYQIEARLMKVRPFQLHGLDVEVHSCSACELVCNVVGH